MPTISTPMLIGIRLGAYKYCDLVLHLFVHLLFKIITYYSDSLSINSTTCSYVTDIRGVNSMIYTRRQIKNDQPGSQDFRRFLRQFP